MMAASRTLSPDTRPLGGTTPYSKESFCKDLSDALAETKYDDNSEMQKIAQQVEHELHDENIVGNLLELYQQCFDAFKKRWHDAREDVARKDAIDITLRIVLDRKINNGLGDAAKRFDFAINDQVGVANPEQPKPL